MPDQRPLPGVILTNEDSLGDLRERCRQRTEAYVNTAQKLQQAEREIRRLQALAIEDENTYDRGVEDGRDTSAARIAELERAVHEIWEMADAARGKAPHLLGRRAGEDHEPRPRPEEGRGG